MKQRMWIVLGGAVIAVILLVVSNRPAVRLFVFREPLFHGYNYTNEDGSFTEMEMPEKGRDLAMVESLYQRHLDETSAPRTRLYRTTPIRPWRFWLWFDYATHPRWRYPYRADDGSNP